VVNSPIKFVLKTGGKKNSKYTIVVWGLKETKIFFINSTLDPSFLVYVWCDKLFSQISPFI
jgi:hypothetical protein